MSQKSDLGNEQESEGINIHLAAFPFLGIFSFEPQRRIKAAVVSRSRQAEYGYPPIPATMVS